MSDNDSPILQIGIHTGMSLVVFLHHVCLVFYFDYFLFLLEIFHFISESFSFSLSLSWLFACVRSVSAIYKFKHQH